MAICEQCGKEHEGTFGSGRFCNRSCSNKWVALHQSEEAKAKKVEKGKGNLTHRGWNLSPEQHKEFSSLGGRKTAQLKKEQIKKKIDMILSGEDTISEVYHGGYSTFRDYLIEFGYKERRCERCRLTEWLGSPIPIELHHKDPNGGSVLSNLEILCPNCHAMTDSHGWKYYNNYIKKSSLSSTGQST